MPYECSTCGKKFSKSSGLATHVLIHSGEKPFKCQKCGTSFRQSGHLKRHELIHDRKGVNVEQLQTSESQTRACTELTIDSSGKRRKSYRCPYCSKLFGHSSNLSKHKRIHTGVKPFSCFMCGTAFTDQTTLRRHVQSNSCKQSFICQLCNIKFVQYEYYKNHVCRPPGDDTSTQPVKTRRKRRAVRPVYAANDEMTLNTENAEQSSLEIGPRQHQQPDDERRHATATVDGDDGNVDDDDDDDDVSRDDKTKCQDSSTTDAGCSEAEANDDPLRPVDLRVDHCDGDDDDDGTGGGCSALNSRPAESSLTAPVTIREGVSSDISCPHCLRQFTLVSSLRRHLLTHTDQRPYECQLCDKSFALPSYLREHQRTHGLGQLLNCPYCDKTFNKPRRLLYHVRTHTGEKPYVCKFCDRRFPQPNGLEIHVRTHTGAKRFKCGECGKMFSQSSNLTTHIKRHMKTANAINVNGDVIKRLVDDDDDDSDVRTATTDADVVVTKNSVLSSKYNERDVKVGDDSDDEQQEVIDVTSADKLLRTDSGRPSLVVKTELGSNGSDDNAKVAFTSQRYVELN